ncbi:hypothetical protein [Phormidium tenue]|uniref:Uncharacterized protein n=1 Tax=Phormidium tenue NIES-30 TaxID=549789 RepID=A0A1U7J291_9CYAN|nr:hypothetical protein [Phormidium tenue]MBD2233716.1 hypothetical protein [Phormidium tenue FACHB-1052]OKH46135.1 hypothetical protein NIES30_17715 [Phormidium tenue NIES-30]
MAGLEETTGVRGHDGDKAEHSIRDVMSGILAAIALIQGRRVVVHDSPSSPVKKGDEPSPLVPGLALEGAPERLGLPAGPIHAEPGKVPEGLGPHPPTDLVTTPGRSPRVQGVVQIQVGDSVLSTTEGTMVVDLMQHEQVNPGFIDGLKMAVKDRELPADAPAVSVFQDGKLEFYRDSEQMFASATFRQEHDASVMDADVVESKPALAKARLPSAGGEADGGPADAVGGQQIGVGSLLSRVMDTCFDPGGGPAKLIGADYEVERGADRSISLRAKDGRGQIFAADAAGVTTQNDLMGQDYERLRVIEQIAVRRGVSAIGPAVAPLTGGIELD